VSGEFAYLPFPTRLLGETSPRVTIHESRLYIPRWD